MKKIFSIAAISLATLGFGLINTSCKTDGLEEKSIGEIDNDLAINDLPIGYRVKSVGDTRFFYKTNGKLDIIRIDGQDFDISAKEIKINKNGYQDDYQLTFDINNNITKVKYTSKVSDSTEEYTENGEGTVKLSYNSNQQIEKITTSYSAEGTDEGEKFTVNSEYTMEFSYNNSRLRRVKKSWNSTENWGGQKETDRATITVGFDYEDGLEYWNNFFQWTPNLIRYAMGNDPEGIFGALSYLGVFGRASAQLPVKITVEESGTSSEAGDYNDNDTHRCFYEFNSYEALRSADGVNYTYTEKDDEYEVKSFVNFETRATQPNKALRHGFIIHRDRK